MKFPSMDGKGIAKPAWWEYVVRFVFGGLVTVGTGLINKKFGSAWGGMLIAFPAILPASLTLVKRHDGRTCAVDDARGARIASFGLLAFALVAVATATRWPPALVLTIATCTWLGVSSALWAVQYGR
jgi:hypothetical protein